MDNYLIGDVLLRWDCLGYSLSEGEYMERFRHSGEWEGETLSLCAHVEPLAPYTSYPCLERNEVYDRYSVAGEPLLIYHWGYLRNAFAVWPERVGVLRDMCMFDPDMRAQPPLSPDWFFGVCGLHGALLKKGAPILHAAYVEYNGKAVLFTAPSQTGKSTQADLWQKYAGATVINGDRVLLRQREGQWHAYGFPCCGSSAICVNRTLPLGAIVVLEQGSDNQLHALTQAQKIRALVSGIEVHLWNINQIDRSIQLSHQIADTIPMIKLSCMPDETAVAVLRQHLEDTNYVTDI